MAMELDTLLADETRLQAMNANFAKRFPRTLPDGRPATLVDVALRRLVVTHRYGWSYARPSSGQP